jgi:hypothetical protein
MGSLARNRTIDAGFSDRQLIIHILSIQSLAAPATRPSSLAQAHFGRSPSGFGAQLSRLVAS